MPYRPEGSLTDWLKRREDPSPLSVEELAHFLSQAADALQHAHDHHLIHQDVKPSNFLIRERSGMTHLPDLLLADFGVAKFLTMTTPASASRSVRGTPAYMAPEQWDGRPVPATDQYALAVMAYQLLTGQNPFQGGPGQLMRQHFTVQPQPPSRLNPSVPLSIDVVILRALEKKPHDRYASITAFAQAYDEALQDTYAAEMASDSRGRRDARQKETRTGPSRMLTGDGEQEVSGAVPKRASRGQIPSREHQEKSVLLPNNVPHQLGNYQLVRPLGQGGFATVYLGRHVHLKSYAAVKVLRAPLTSEDLIDQFRIEAQTIAELIHPNIVRVLDFDVQDDLAFLVMEEAPYGSLRRQYKLGTQLPLPAVLSYVRQVAAALQYAHDNKIIHRDVKPGNMLVGRNSAILLSDFGIAQIAESSGLQRTAEAAGTVAYMAPEQIQGKPRPASDQYALAITVYEWLCGRQPFRGTITEVTTQHLSTPPPPLHASLPDIPPDVEAIVLQALEKEPADRFPTVQAFAHALEEAAGVPPRPPSYERFVPLTADVIRSGSATIVLGEGSSRRERILVQTSRAQRRPGASSPGPEKPPLISRRSMVFGALALIGAGGAGLAWAASHQAPVVQLVQPKGSVTQPAQASPQATQPGATTTPNPPPTQAPTSVPTQDPTPDGTLFTTYRGHVGFVVSAAWSPDGTRIVSGSADKTAQIWNAADGGSILTYTGHTRIVNHVDWSPDGTRIVSGSDDTTVQVWNAVTGGLFFTCTGHTNNVQCVVFSPDGKRIATGSADTTVRIWDAATGNLLMTYRDHTATVWTVAWSPDGTKVATAAGSPKFAPPDYTVKVWDILTGTTIVTYTGHTNSVLSVAWSPDGTRIVSASDDMTAQVWDAATGTRLLTYRGHQNSVLSVAWSPDGSLIASGSLDTTVAVWDVKKDSTRYTYRGHSATTFGMAFSPDGVRIASTSVDNTVQVWRA